MKTTKEKKTYLPKYFLSKGNYPTSNAVMAYLIYLTKVPKDWNGKKIHEPTIQKIRDHFGWNHPTGFTAMIQWGIKLGCSKSRTSDGRYQAMSIAFRSAQGLIGKGVTITDVTIEKKKEEPHGFGLTKKNMWLAA